MRICLIGGKREILHKGFQKKYHQLPSNMKNNLQKKTSNYSDQLINNCIHKNDCSQIAEGSDDKEKNRPTVKKYFLSYFDRKWNKRVDEKELARTLNNIIHLRRKYPKVYEEVLSELGLDTKDFACWRKFFDEEQRKFDRD
jgi:hypothetical protein